MDPAPGPQPGPFHMPRQQNQPTTAKSTPRPTHRPHERSGLGIDTTFHKLRHYSATKLIRAGVDIRTVAGRLGYVEGGTTLAFYVAWVREADQRACRILMRRLPMPDPTPESLPFADSPRPRSPYQVIADGLRAAIYLNGALPDEHILPTVKELAIRHRVSPATAHRAITVLVREQLVVVSRGRRANRPPPLRQGGSRTVTTRLACRPRVECLVEGNWCDQERPREYYGD